VIDCDRPTAPGFSAWKAALLAAVAFVVGAVACLAYWLYWPDVWEGDVPAVVAEGPAAPDYSGYRVEFTAPLPPEALDRDADGGRVSERRAAVTTGDRVTCRVRQSFQNRTDITTGPRTEVLSCRPA
jgi:hypothetical protein